MAALNFPNSPSNGDIYSANGSTFTYNGTAWIRSTTSSVLAINTTVDPDSNPNSVVAGNIADGSGWGALGIGGNNGTGDSWAIAHNGSNLYMAMGDGSSDDSLQTFLQIEPGVTDHFYFKVIKNSNIGMIMVVA